MRHLENGKVAIFDKTFEVFGYLDDTLFCDIKSRGSWHEFDSFHLPDLIARDDVCLDLGANIGMSTLALSLLVPGGHVYAFEGSPETTLALEKTIRANALSNVSVSNVVVGQASAKVKFFDMPDVRTSGHYVPIETPRDVTSLSQDSLQIVVSETRSVDQLVALNGLTRLDFIKIDVEGAELDVLRGAAATLARFSPLVMMEFNSYAFMHLREIPPRRALRQIFDTFDEVFLFKNRAGQLTRLDDTERCREKFLHENLFNGFVDDLLCVFSKTRAKRTGLLDAIERDSSRRQNSDSRIVEIALAQATQPLAQEFVYGGAGVTASTMPTNFSQATRHHGAAIMHIAPSRAGEVSQLQFRIRINCFVSEPNSVVIGVFQDGLDGAVGLLVESLSPGRMTVVERDFSISVARDLVAPAFEIRVGLAHRGGTLLLNHDPLSSAGAPVQSTFRVQWLK